MVGFTGFDFLNAASNLEPRRECGGVNDRFNGLRRAFFCVFVAWICDFNSIRGNIVCTVIAGFGGKISQRDPRLVDFHQLTAITRR